MSRERDEYYLQLMQDPSYEDQLAVGIDIARESIARVRDRVAGIQVSAPFGNIDAACAVIAE